MPQCPDSSAVLSVCSPLKGETGKEGWGKREGKKKGREGGAGEMVGENKETDLGYLVKVKWSLIECGNLEFWYFVLFFFFHR